MSLKAFGSVVLIVALGAVLWCLPTLAQPDHSPHPAPAAAESVEQITGHDVDAAPAHEAKEAEHGSEAHGEEEKGTFQPEYGTWFHPLVQKITGQENPKWTAHGEEHYFTNVQYDFLAVALFIMACIGIVGVLGARAMKLRPEGKPASLSHLVETAAEGFRDYLIGVMGKELAFKYAPLISSYFFTILLFNWMGLVPGMLSPTANPNIPVSLAIVAFFCVHFIAIREAGFKSWFMHLVGEPLWLAPLNFPLHVLGEFIKPMSLSIRLLCNVFGEEMVILQLSLLAVGLLAVLHVPLPLQFPMLCLGLFFGLLQALVFSTLLAIYIAILATHHDDHDEHNAHGHVEHVDDGHGHERIIGHPSETTIA